MIGIKVCGITTREDALFISRGGVNALGFIFYEKSPRFISVDRARSISAELPDSIARVGVFVNAPVESVRQTAADCRLTMIQLHGDESPAYCRDISFLPVIKAIAPDGGMDRDTLNRYRVHAFLVDAKDAQRRGGTGKTADWNTAAVLARQYPLILSGGLNPGNILDALHAVSPRAVDINSGVEDSPGKKNHDRISEIVALIRATERNSGETETTLFHGNTRLSPGDHRHGRDSQTDDIEGNNDPPGNTTTAKGNHDENTS